jgi:hypothetical protein
LRRNSSRKKPARGGPALKKLVNSYENGGYLAGLCDDIVIFDFPRVSFGKYFSIGVRTSANVRSRAARRV